MVDDLAETFFVLRAVSITDDRLRAGGDTKIDTDEEVKDIDIDGHCRNAVFTGKLDNGDIEEDRYDTRGQLGEHFTGAVEAGFDKIPFVPVEFGKAQVRFVDLEISQTHQRRNGDRGDSGKRSTENAPAQNHDRIIVEGDVEDEAC